MEKLPTSIHTSMTTHTWHTRDWHNVVNMAHILLTVTLFLDRSKPHDSKHNSATFFKLYFSKSSPATYKRMLNTVLDSRSYKKAMTKNMERRRVNTRRRKKRRKKKERRTTDQVSNDDVREQRRCAEEQLKSPLSLTDQNCVSEKQARRAECAQFTPPRESERDFAVSWPI